MIKKTIATTILTSFILLTGFLTLLFNPQPLFGHHLSHDKFDIYANFSLESEILTPIIDQALKTIQESELYDQDYTYDLFFIHNTFYNKMDNLLFNPYAAARPTGNNINVKCPVDLKQSIGLTDKSEIDLTYMLIHEMVHCLQENRYGKLKFNPFSHPPMWKLEGYPELLSRQHQLYDANYDLKKEVQRYLSLKAQYSNGWLPVLDNHFVPDIYFKGRIMVEYLMRVKGLTYDDILQQSIKEAPTYKELLKWAKAE